jgi:hypothetical protein
MSNLIEDYGRIKDRQTAALAPRDGFIDESRASSRLTEKRAGSVDEAIVDLSSTGSSAMVLFDQSRQAPQVIEIGDGGIHFTG